MGTFAQKCLEFEANYNRLRLQRDNWQQIRIGEVLPRLGGTLPEEFISEYSARQNPRLFFECGSEAETRRYGIVLTVGKQKRKVVYVRR